MESEICRPTLEPGLACGLLWATEYTEVTQNYSSSGPYFKRSESFCFCALWGQAAAMLARSLSLVTRDETLCEGYKMEE